MILEVACPIPLPKTFDYKLPPDLNIRSADGEGEGDLRSGGPREPVVRKSLRSPSPSPSAFVGRRVRISFGFKQGIGIVCGIKETSDAPIAKLKPISSFIDDEPILSEEMIALARWLSQRYACAFGEALFALLPHGKPKAGTGDVDRSDLRTTGSCGPSERRSTSPVPALTGEQIEATDAVRIAVKGGEQRAFLLYGVAAAGKTEVYMAAIAEALAQGRTALYLAPEIGLAISTADVLKARFGENSVLLYHGSVSASTRYDDWWRIKRGEFPIVVGPRSTALAPLSNVGVIIVDEEHDSAYKEDRKPRFHARDVALERARQEKAVAILGSATPSLETFYAAKQGDLTALELNERAVPSEAPRIKLVDLRIEKFRGAISPTLQTAIDERLKRREQAILFINRRGFHRYLRCSNCGWVARCPNCDVSLTEHKEKKVASLVCHYCAHSSIPPGKCPDCKHVKLFAGGSGTQRIEEEMKENLPWARTMRWDVDAAKRKGSSEILYEKFKSGEADVLVGTQMIAHGFNFPNVTLVGVVDADGPLHIPDFRAAEHAFQLVTQVAGRSGRALTTGDVIIQTRNPDHYALKFSSQMDYPGFAETELKFRQELNYPPFTHIVQITTESKTAEKDVELISGWLWNLQLEEPVGILGPTKARRGKKKGHPRFQILVKVPKAIFSEFLTRFSSSAPLPFSRFSVDVDPQ